MRLPPLLLLTAALLLSSACKSESRNDSAATPGAPAANAQPTPPPGSIEVTAATLKKELEKNPDDLVSRYNLGTAYFYEGKYLEAAEEFRFVAEKKPDDADALDKLGMAYAGARRFDEAADAFQRALRLKPRNAAYFHQALADVYEKAGRTAEAARERAEYQRLDPNVRVKTLVAAGKLDEAVAEARKVSPANAETHYVLGTTLLKLNRPGEALDAFREAIRLNPRHADAYFQTGNTHDRLNRPKEAAEAFAGAVRLRPSDAEARVRLAVAHLKQGNAAAAREQQEALKSLDPEAAKQLQQAIEQGSKNLP